MVTEFKSEDVDVESWIDEGVSYLQAQVKIFRDPGMFAEYGPLMEKIKILEDNLRPKREPRKDRGLDEESVGGNQEAVFSDESLGDETRSEVQQELDETRAEAKVLYDKYAANTETWTLRRLNEEEVIGVKETIGEMPEMPPKPSPTKMPKAQQVKALEKMREWSVAMQEYSDEVHVHCLALSTMSVAVKDKVIDHVTIEGIRRLRKRPGGDAHFKELVRAMTELTAEGVEIMAPHRSGAGA
jgi:hypothetical protein